MENNLDSILLSTKKLLGLTEDYTVFDADIIMHINSVFMILTQLGVGPSNGFSIAGKEDLWTAFVPADDKNYEAVKSYMYAKVRLMFDPPSSSIVMECMKQMIAELEWRLNLAAES